MARVHVVRVVTEYVWSALRSVRGPAVFGDGSPDRTISASMAYR